MPLDPVALGVFVLLLCGVSALGVAAARWRRGDLDLLHEWGLAGGRFGTVITWFLLGGDLYTAYTFIAVPSLAFGAGAIAFFSIPYTILAYPVLLLVFPRLWSVARQHGYITAADVVRGRFGSRWLALAVAATGIIATIPYISLQLVGIQVVVAALGIEAQGWLSDLPLLIAFAVLAAFTWTSGLRAPAAIAVVKDLMIYATVIAMVVIIPAKLGGYGRIFAAVPPSKLLLAPATAGNWRDESAFASLALGSALALFLYPHSITGIFSTASRRAVRRNAALLPAYSFLLGLVGLLGFMAIAAKVDRLPAFAPLFKHYGANFAVPALMLETLPPWFVGFGFAAIAIGALVPAAIMSIAAANIWTRNLQPEILGAHRSPRDEARIAKRAALLVKLAALLFIVLLPQQYAINLQLLGGIWIIQTLPAVVIGLYTRWLDPRALLLGWTAGMISGTALFAVWGKIVPLTIGGVTIPGYAALYSLVINLVVSVLATPMLRPRTLVEDPSEGRV